MFLDRISFAIASAPDSPMELSGRSSVSPRRTDAGMVFSMSSVRSLTPMVLHISTTSAGEGPRCLGTKLSVAASSSLRVEVALSMDCAEGAEKDLRWAAGADALALRQASTKAVHGSGPCDARLAKLARTRTACLSMVDSILLAKMADPQTQK